MHKGFFSLCITFLIILKLFEYRSTFNDLNTFNDFPSRSNLNSLKPEPKMFKDGKFVELKGSYFDRAMKKKFVRDRPAFCVNLQAVIG